MRLPCSEIESTCYRGIVRTLSSGHPFLVTNRIGAQRIKKVTKKSGWNFERQWHKLVRQENAIGSSVPCVLIISLLKGYRYLISPLLGITTAALPFLFLLSGNRSFVRFGLFRGGWLSLQRLSKCHPWHSGESIRFQISTLNLLSIIALQLRMPNGRSTFSSYRLSCYSQLFISSRLNEDYGSPFLRRTHK